MRIMNTGHKVSSRAPTLAKRTTRAVGSLHARTTAAAARTQQAHSTTKPTINKTIESVGRREPFSCRQIWRRSKQNAKTRVPKERSNITSPSGLIRFVIAFPAHQKRRLGERCRSAWRAQLGVTVVQSLDGSRSLRWDERRLRVVVISRIKARRHGGAVALSLA